MKKMIKMEKWKLFLMVFCLFIAGCSNEDEPVVLTPETTAVSLSGEGDSQTIGVTCNKKWTAISSLDWCKVTVQENAVVISAEENKTGAELKADVTLTCEDVKAVIKVTQGVPAVPVNSVFAQTSEHWLFDFSGFSGAYKTVWDACLTSLENEEGGKHALQWMSLTKDTIAFVIHNEMFKDMGAPEEMYTYEGTLLFTIEAVAGTKDQVAFKGIKVDPDAGEDNKGEYWYGEKWGNDKFRDFVNTLVAQKYTIVADVASAPQVLTFTGVADPRSVFKLKLKE